MPKFDGKRLIETLRSQQSPIPIVAMSASLENFREALVALGVSGLLSKPFRYNELVSLVRTVLSRVPDNAAWPLLKTHENFLERSSLEATHEYSKSEPRRA